jgi:HD-GYP domain-containing protein (c-di-GMP phosphodiesterase class II)
MSPEHKTEKSVDNFLTIYLETLRVDSVPDFDLYIDKGGQLILYRASKLSFTEKARATLLENDVRKLYVSTDEQPRYQKYVEANIKEILNDTSIEEVTKAGIVYDSAKMLVKEVLCKPTRGENIKRSEAMVESTISLILGGHDAFQSLLQVMSFNYHTYTHSVNVCTYSLALGRFVGITSPEELKQLGTGAILHDVGMTRIPESILSKREALTSDEWEMIKRHPLWGYEIIKETDLISDASCAAIIQHHEREDGSGYPNKIDSEYIHRYSKIVAIADAFDAMTTKRIYRPAKDTFPVLKTIFDQGNAFDRQLLNQFTKLLGPGLAAT